jgi:hypothetical protein
VTALALFLFGCYAAWHGFTTGGMTGFMMLMGAVVVWLFSVAALGMSDDSHVARSTRPPEHPPGWKNVKRK